jgi:hypothetical protein
MSTIGRAMLAPVLAAAAAGAAVSSGYGPASTAACPPQYVISAAVGMPLSMYSQDEFAKQHPTTGEVMLRGQMSGMSGSSAMGTASPGAMGSSSAMGAMGSSGMPGPGGASSTLRHLEVYIHSKATGAVVQDASPKITVTDTTAGGPPQDVPVAVMEGIGANGKRVLETLHYGNNISMPGGHKFTTAVTVGCQTASAEPALGLARRTGETCPRRQARRRPAQGGRRRTRDEAATEGLAK